jgi:hypothetical protein
MCVGSKFDTILLISDYQDRAFNQTPVQHWPVLKGDDVASKKASGHDIT